MLKKTLKKMKKRLQSRHQGDTSSRKGNGLAIVIFDDQELCSIRQAARGLHRSVDNRASRTPVENSGAGGECVHSQSSSSGGSDLKRT